MPQQLLPYWNTLKRWGWLIVVGAVLASISAYFYWRNQPPVYQAHTALLIGNSVQSTNPDPQQLGLERTLATFYSEMAKRQPITRAVIQRLGLSMSPDELSAVIETRVVFDAQILEIHVYDVDPQRAAALTMAIAEELIRQSPAAAAVQDASREFIKKQVADLELRINDLDAQMIELRNSMADMTSASDLTEARAKATELDNLKSAYTTAYTQYLAILDNQGVNSLSIVEPASPPTRPVSIGLATTILIALAGSLVLSLGAIVLLEYSDNVLRWGDMTLEKGLSVLGIMPALPRKFDRLIIRSHSDSAEADVVRSLRTRIFLADSGAMIKRLLVTSPMPRDGKTFSVVNLAVAAADAGLRVILVDGDVRAGTVHEYFGCEHEPGLTNLLWSRSPDRAPYLDLLRRTQVRNLWVLPAGTLTRDPLTLLRSPRLAQLMDQISERADLILVDSPPLTAGPIATLLSNVVDGIVMVVNLDRTRRKSFELARDDLVKHSEAPLLGLALNRVRLSKFAEHGHYLYGYGHSGPPKGMLDRLRDLPGTLIGQITHRLGLSRNGRQPEGLPDHWLEDTPAAIGEELPEAAEAQAGADNTPAAPAVRTDSEILTTAEVAAQLEVPEETVEEWCRTGQLPAVRIGRRWLVTGLTLPAAAPDAASGAASPDAQA